MDTLDKLIAELADLPNSNSETDAMEVALDCTVPQIVVRLQLLQAAEKRAETVIPPAIAAVLLEAIQYEEVTFDLGGEINGADLVEWFTAWRTRAAEAVAFNKVPEPEPVTLAITMEGGIIQAIHSDNPARLKNVSVINIDFDVDCAEEGSTLIVPRLDGKEGDAAYVNEYSINQSDVDLAELYTMMDERAAKDAEETE